MRGMSNDREFPLFSFLVGEVIAWLLYPLFKEMLHIETIGAKLVLGFGAGAGALGLVILARGRSAR
jgi:hypothetical protein